MREAERMKLFETSHFGLVTWIVQYTLSGLAACLWGLLMIGYGLFGGAFDKPASGQLCHLTGLDSESLVLISKGQGSTCCSVLA